MLDKNKQLAMDMFGYAMRLINCAMENCEKSYKAAEKDTKLRKLKETMKEEKDDTKREKLIKEINSNKKIVEYHNCLYKNCLSILKNTMKTILAMIKLNDLKPDADLIKKAKELMKKDKLNKKEIKEFSDVYLSLLLFIKHNKKAP